MPPMIDNPAVQFRTPSAAAGLPSDGGGLDVHGTALNAEVVPQEHPPSRSKLRTTNIQAAATLATNPPI